MNKPNIAFQSAIFPGESWGGIRLGDSMVEVLQSLRKYGLESNATRDSMELDMDSPPATLHFLEANVPNLVLIIVDSPEATVLGKGIIGCTLSEALNALSVSIREEPFWSMVSIDEEYRGGKKLGDQKRPTGRFTDLELLNGGTLWIRRLGIGLCLNAGLVVSIALCKSENVPKIGCGTLAQSIFDCARDPELQHKLQARHLSPSRKKNVSVRMCLWIVLFLLGIGVLGTSYLGWQEYDSWQSGVVAKGQVVEVKHEGASLVALVVEYDSPAGKALTTIPSQYTTAREVGQQVEVVFRTKEPKHAMTKLQARDNFSPTYLYLPIGLLLVFNIVLCWLFPQFSRRRWW